jgi:hypothetical protein
MARCSEAERKDAERRNDRAKTLGPLAAFEQHVDDLSGAPRGCAAGLAPTSSIAIPDWQKRSTALVDLVSDAGSGWPPTRSGGHAKRPHARLGDADADAWTASAPRALRGIPRIPRHRRARFASARERHGDVERARAYSTHAALDWSLRAAGHGVVWRDSQVENDERTLMRS